MPDRRSDKLAKAVLALSDDPRSTEIVTIAFKQLPAEIGRRFVATAVELVELEQLYEAAPCPAGQILASILKAGGVVALAGAIEAATGAREGGRLQHAAAILRGRKGGRPPIDDRGTIADINTLRARGMAQGQAIGIVLRTLCLTGKDAEAFSRRIREKLKNSRRK